MAGFEDFRVFVGGLSWDTEDKSLEQAFRRFGKVVEAKVMMDRDSGRPRGFGFVTFTDEQSMEDAIAELHGRELDGRIISVNKAQPKMGGGGGGGGGDFGYGGGYGNGGGRGGYQRGGGSDDCFKCGKPGHWARECPHGGGGAGGGGGGGRFPPRYGNGGGGSGGGFRNDRYGGGGPGYGDRYGDRERGGDRSRERYGRDRYGSDRYDGYTRDSRGGYDRESARGAGAGAGSGAGAGAGAGAGGRYGSGGPVRYDGGGYRDRSGPYDRPSARPSYDDRY